MVSRAAGRAEEERLRAEEERRRLEASLEPPPTLPAAGGPLCSLIVCPLSVLSNWTQQIEEHTAGGLSVSTPPCPDALTCPED